MHCVASLKPHKTITQFPSAQHQSNSQFWLAVPQPPRLRWGGKASFPQRRPSALTASTQPQHLTATERKTNHISTYLREVSWGTFWTERRKGTTGLKLAHLPPQKYLLLICCHGNRAQPSTCADAGRVKLPPTSAWVPLDNQLLNSVSAIYANWD